MNSSFSEIRGQGMAVSILSRALESGRVASSYLFEGPDGVGKELVALALARALLDLDGSAEKRLREGAHPDVRVFSPREDGKRNIPVEFLRQQILPVAQYAPFEARSAVLIFPEADISFPAHPAEAANALLKTLEEPRPNVHFVLLSARPERLLQTIRSRCQRIRFSRLPKGDLNEILEAKGIPEAERQSAIALADGRADRALSLTEGGAMDLLDQALELDAACIKGGPGTLVRSAEAIIRSSAPLPAVLDTLILYYRDVAVSALGRADESLAFSHRADEIRNRAKALGAAGAAKRVELLQQAQGALERNANPQLTLDALLYAARG